MRAPALSSPADSPHIRANGETSQQAPEKTQGPARPTRAKASRPDAPATPDALADLLNPAINKGTAGMGSGTGTSAAAGQFVRPPRRFFRRAQGAQIGARRVSARRRRATTPASPITGLDPALAKELGLGDERMLLSPPPCAEGSGAGVMRTRRTHRLPPPQPPPQGGREKTRSEIPAAEGRPAAAGQRAGVDGRRRHRAGAGKSVARGPAGIHRAAVDAAPAAAAGEIRRRPEIRHRLRLRAEGRPAGSDPRTGRRRQAQRPHPGAARRHRLGQDLHHGQGDRGDAAPGAHPRAEQDAGGAALRRVQVVLPRQRGGIFRLLLRLLPAGSLRPAHRHLYREGILDQRADRPHAPFGDARAAGARRRHHRRLGVVHLRHRLGRNLFGHDLHAQAGRQDRAAPADGRSGGAAIQAHAGRFLPRLVPRARRHHRHLPGALRGPRLARASVRRRDREDRGDGSAHRPEDRRAGIRQGLRQLALRHAAADAHSSDARHQAGTARPPRPAQRRRPPAWKRSGSSSARCTIWK